MLQWICNQLSDLNMITMVLVPLLVSLITLKLGLWFTRRNIIISELKQRVLSLNDRSQTKMVLHKARKEQLASMGTGSSVYIKKNTMVTELAEIITETAKILEQLNEARKTKDIKMISNKVDMLEAKYGNIPFGSILPEIPITIS